MFLSLDGRGPRHAQLTRALKQAVLDGRLRTGQRLPSTRTLAAELQLSRNTVLASYEELSAEGFLQGKVGSGSYVAAIESAPAPDTAPVPGPIALSAYARRGLDAHRQRMPGGEHRDLRYNLQYGAPLVNTALTSAWRRELSRAAAYAPMDYPDAQGLPALREALCGYLARRRGLVAAPEQVLIVSGTQEAFALSAQVLLDPGDRVAIEDPHYRAASRVFHAHGLLVEGIPVDAEGAVCAALRTTPAAKLACVTPSHQFPTGAVMSLQRRMALLRHAREHDAWILEDDYDGEFRYAGAPLAALRALDAHDRTLYVGTFSKALFPSLRLGYMVLPQALVRAFRTAKWLADAGCAAIEQLALAHFIDAGGFERHLRRAAKVLRARRSALVEGLRTHAGDRLEVSDARAGMHLVAWLRDYDAARCAQLVALGRGVGLGLYPIAPYYLQPQARQALLLGYCGLGVGEIQAATQLLGRCMAQLDAA
jgi:GntR family transcriptional regulator/MocR family aminotransferase